MTMLNNIFTFLGLIGLGFFVVTVGIVLGYQPLTIYLTCFGIGATLGYVKGKYFYEKK